MELTIEMLNANGRQMNDPANPYWVAAGHSDGAAWATGEEAESPVARFIVVIEGKGRDRRVVVIDTTCNRRSSWGDPALAQADADRRNAA